MSLKSINLLKKNFSKRIENDDDFNLLTQILCVYHVATCYICFDNLLCIVNLHVAGQFRILQHRLKNLGNAIRDETGLPRYENCCYERLKDCVVQHQTLIEYCKRLEDIFTVMVLGQVMFLAVVICLVGFQLFLIRMPILFHHNLE